MFGYVVSRNSELINFKRLKFEHREHTVVFTDSMYFENTSLDKTVSSFKKERDVNLKYVNQLE